MFQTTVSAQRPFKSLLLFIALICAFATAPAAYAQSNRASLSGRALDSNGAAVPGARVALRQSHTNVEFTAAADGAGTYSFKDLAPGAYTLSASGEGFAVT